MVTDKNAQRWIIISTMFTGFMIQLDTYIVNISLPTIADYFNVNTGDVSYVVLVYLLFLTSTLLIFGKLADRIGLKKVFISGFLLFTMGSLLCGISWSLRLLILARIIQGIGGAMLYTSVFAIVSRFLPQNLTGYAFGLLSTSSALGVTAGAPVGGLITGYFSWHWIFLINIPFGIAAIIVALKVIPVEKIPEEKNKNTFDIAGSILSFLGFLSLIYTLKMGEELGCTSPVIIASAISTVIFITLFIIRETRCHDPLLDLALFKNKNFTFANIASLMAFILISGNTFIMPFYLQYILDLNTQKAGMVLLAYSLVYIFAGPVGGKFADRVRTNYLCALAMLLASGACVAFAFILSYSSLTYVIVFLMLLAVSVGFFGPPNNKQIMMFASSDKQGVASGVMNMIKNTGLILGVSICETIFSSGIHEASVSELNNLSHAILAAGFRNVYIFAGFICFVSMIFSFLLKGEKRVVV